MLIGVLRHSFWKRNWKINFQRAWWNNNPANYEYLPALIEWHPCLAAHTRNKTETVTCNDCLIWTCTLVSGIFLQCFYCVWLQTPWTQPWLATVFWTLPWLRCWKWKYGHVSDRLPLHKLVGGWFVSSSVRPQRRHLFRCSWPLRDRCEVI